MWYHSFITDVLIMRENHESHNRGSEETKNDNVDDTEMSKKRCLLCRD